MKENPESINAGNMVPLLCFTSDTFRSQHKMSWGSLILSQETRSELKWSRNIELCCGNTGWSCPLSFWSATPSSRFCTRRTFWPRPRWRTSSLWPPADRKLSSYWTSCRTADLGLSTPSSNLWRTLDGSETSCCWSCKREARSPEVGSMATGAPHFIPFCAPCARLAWTYPVPE